LNNHALRKQRLRHEWRLTTVIALALLAVLTFADIARPLGNVLYDHLMRLQGFRATQNIVIIAIDDRSIQELGGWPIQRKHYGQLLAQINDDCCKPKVVGFDLLFLDPSADDIPFAEHLKHHKSVLPLAFKVKEDDLTSLQAVRPVPSIAEAATLAHINLSFDTDGVIRGFQAQEQTWPHFSLAMHDASDQKRTTNTENKGYRRFRMVDPSVGFPMVSLADAIHSRASRTLLKDKYVLVGVTAPSLGDRYPTLYSGKNNASTPGVAILASVLNASLNNALIEEAPAWVVFAATLIPLLAMLQSLLILKPRYALMLAAIMIIGTIAGSYATLSLLDYWVDPIPFIIIAILLQPLWAWRRLEAIVHFVQDKATDLRLFQAKHRTSQNVKPSREVVLKYANLLDDAVASARTELDFLSLIVDEMPDSVFIFNAQDQLLLCNQKVKQLFSEHAVQAGSSLVELATHLSIPAGSLEKIDASSALQSVFQLNTSMGLRHFLLKATKLDSPIEDNIRLVILMDVTELRQSQAQRDRALQFLSHDMRTPIASILSLTHRASGEADEVERKITHHARALLNMMDDFILTISAEASQYNVQQVLLDNLINDTLEEVTDLAKAKGITIQDDTDASSVFVAVNTRLFVRALINLLFNAIKFSPTHSIIKIQTTCSGHTELGTALVVINISNQIDEIGSSSHPIPSMPGFGLGLDFVDNVIQKHHGSIERAIPAHGRADVTVTLPCEITNSSESS
jgi:CHASE2 domain-containing sensor protein/nitrogen-specific signal transduction histidine kinase